MSKFKTRLKYYLIGFGLGLVFMFFLFGNRACSWLPENRVKNMLAEKEIRVGDSIADLMDCQGVTNDDVYRFLNDDGDVNFSKSVTDKEPKEYLIEGEKNNEKLTIRYALHSRYSEVIAFDFPQNNCETELTNQHKSVIPLPNVEVIEIIESNEFRILEKAECQMSCYGLNEEDIHSFHRSATVIMEDSDPRGEPNPTYVMQGKLNGRLYRMTYIIGESRTRISDISAKEKNCDCN